MEASTSAVRLFSRVVKRQRLPSQATRSFSSCGCLRSASAADDRYPDAARSSFLRTTTKDALAVKGIKWQEPVEEEPQDARGDLIGKDVEEMLGASGGSKEGRQTKKMKYADPRLLVGIILMLLHCSMYQAVRDAMAITLAKDDSAVVFGEGPFLQHCASTRAHIRRRCRFWRRLPMHDGFGRRVRPNTSVQYPAHVRSALPPRSSLADFWNREQGIAGFGIGLASMGQTAIAEIQFAD